MINSNVRELFPHLKTGQIYFNHAAIGPWCTHVLDRISEYMKDRSGERVENYSSFLNWSSSAKEKLGRLIGSETDRIAWIDNVSNGLNLLARGLNWKTGDRVIINDIEFPSNVYPFLNLKQFGVEIDIIKSKNGIIDPETIFNSVTTRTRIISISLVQFLSGYRTDIELLGEFCRSRGIIFSVDAIQATGVVDIDVVKSKVDFLCGGTQKWLMASQGLSYLYITEELQERITQSSVGWTSVENAWNLLDYDLKLKKTAERFQNGTVNALGVAAFDAVLELFTGAGMKKIESAVLSNTKYFFKKLEEIGIEPILKNADEKNLAGIVTFRHPDAVRIYEELQKRKIFGAVREGMIRFSPHFYNTYDEIDLVIDELRKLE